MAGKKVGPGTPVQPISTIREIPLYLIPRVVAEQIKEKRESVFQITVTRSNLHYYTVVVTTSEVRQDTEAISVEPEPAIEEGQ
ncbi:MAG: hypothetical protein A4E36_01121 [Methanoregulaceae archaeon PtaB.Bin009]|jgi:hypothetical protein|nr:MAG: hypothetical protein A4E36_01121 [Methanoregulaceae archaeon PtaB.Bin009]OPY43020.1 MAG: hypothetical protein A4E41_00005 [Methanoregulaceae archaeon PtaU1.Bin066]